MSIIIPKKEYTLEDKLLRYKEFSLLLEEHEYNDPKSIREEKRRIKQYMRELNVHGRFEKGKKFISISLKDLPKAHSSEVEKGERLISTSMQDPLKAHSSEVEEGERLFSICLQDLREADPSEYVEADNARETFDTLITPYHNRSHAKKVHNKQVAEWGHVTRQAYEAARRDPGKMSPMFLMVACLYFYIDVERTKEMFCTCVGTDPLSAGPNTRKLGRAIELFLTDPECNDDRRTDEAYVNFVKVTAGAYAYDSRVELPPFLSRNPFWKACYLQTKNDLSERGLL